MNFNRVKSSLFVGVVTMFLFAGLNTFAAGSDPVIFSFTTVGDSRYDKKEPGATAEDTIWQQNTKALSRILREMHEQKPQALFFNGDMIMAYTTNQAELDKEYAYWRGMVANLMEEGTYIVPVPGNHEVQIKVKPKKAKAANAAEGEEAASPKKEKKKDAAADEDVLKVAQPECEDAWRRNMGDLILETNLWQSLVGAPVEAFDINNTPPIGGADGIVSDQRQLTYSFDCKGIHFTMINTDAVRNDTHAPVHWLEQDLAAAKKRGCKTFLLFGHKMAYTYQFHPTFKAKGLDLFPENADAFWKLVLEYNATYFCGHEHIYHAMQPVKRGGREPWQIICGSGGSPFEAKPGMSTNVDDRKYAWALVKVHASGLVETEVRGFDEHYGPTETIQKITLQYGK